MERIESWIKWIKWLFRTIPTTKQAIDMGLKHQTNIYGDRINTYGCRSLWIDKYGRRFSCAQILDGGRNIFNEILEKEATEHLKQLKTAHQEKIVCAAICNPEEKDMAGNPLIYCGLRHANILWQGKMVSRNPHHQGFLTTEGRFVSREEGLKIALENNQVMDISQIRGNRLFSEDLY